MQTHVADTSNMIQILKILDFRNDEAIRENGTALRDLAAGASSENQFIVTIAEKTRKDSKVMRVATIIAIFYLPASLVAVRTTSNV